MRKWIDLFENSIFSDADPTIFGEEGTLTLFHASPHKITTFHPFSHFGTEDAAFQRGNEVHSRTGFFVYECEIDIGTTVEILDSGYGQHDVEGIMTYLETILGLDYHAVEEVFRDAADSAELLLSLGIDTLQYTNRREDAGSVSYVILDPARVKIKNIDRV